MIDQSFPELCYKSFNIESARHVSKNLEDEIYLFFHFSSTYFGNLLSIQTNSNLLRWQTSFRQLEKIEL